MKYVALLSVDMPDFWYRWNSGSTVKYYRSNIFSNKKRAEKWIDEELKKYPNARINHNEADRTYIVYHSILAFDEKESARFENFLKRWISNPISHTFDSSEKSKTKKNNTTNTKAEDTRNDKSSNSSSSTKATKNNSESIKTNISEYEKAGINVVVHNSNGELLYASNLGNDDEYCDKCPYLRFEDDPDPYDWFCDDEKKAVCRKYHKEIAGALGHNELTYIPIPDFCDRLKKASNKNE